jgi:tetratricopeptide (TPR) repeat protein
MAKTTPQIYQYLKKYQENPRSRIFAPLAEAYRKAGLLEEAIDIAREGLQMHPGFAGGKVALARALFDKQLFEEVINELTPVVRDVPDNLMAQRLVADSALMLGRLAEALSHYKMLLYFSPQDEETIRLVAELEIQAYEKGVLVLQTDPIAAGAANAKGLSGFHAAEIEQRRKQWIRKVELLQQMLLKVEKSRSHV